MTPSCVLTIDEDLDCLQSLQDLLEFEGFEVLPFLRGNTALSAFAVKKVPDLILLSLISIELDGKPFMERKREHRILCQVPVLVLSAAPGIAHRIDELGAEGFIAKPADANHLLSEIRRLIKKA